MAKGFGVSVPDLAVYGVLAYVGYVLFKPLISTAKSISDVAAIPSNLLSSVESGNFATTIKTDVMDFWNLMNLGIPKALHLY